MSSVVALLKGLVLAPLQLTYSQSSLGTRSFAVRRKGLGTFVHPSCPQDGMLTWPIRIVDCKLRHGNEWAYIDSHEYILEREKKKMSLWSPCMKTKTYLTLEKRRKKKRAVAASFHRRSVTPNYSGGKKKNEPTVGCNSNDKAMVRITNTFLQCIDSTI